MGRKAITYQLGNQGFLIFRSGLGAIQGITLNVYYGSDTVLGTQGFFSKCSNGAYSLVKRDRR